MGKFLKFLIIALIAAIIIIIVAIVLFINPNDFKPQISKFVYQETGHKLTIDGKLHWSFFPKIAVTADKVTLENVASIGHGALQVELLPLFKGHIKTHKFVLENVRLVVNKNRFIKLDDFTGKDISLHKGWLKGKFQARLYSGVISGYGQMQLASRHFKLNAKLHGLELAPLLNDSAGVKRVTGTADMTAQLNDLNGAGKIALQNGKLLGVDIGYQLASAKALINKKPLPKRTGPVETDFGQLTATYTLKNGLVSNQDLLLKASRYQMTGKGTLNLLTGKLAYQLRAQSGKIFVPIMVTGTYQKPRFVPDFTAILNHFSGKILSSISRLIFK